MLRFAGYNFINEDWLANHTSEWISLLAYILLIAFFIRATKKK